jgi:hypothetical protein
MLSGRGSAAPAALDALLSAPVVPDIYRTCLEDADRAGFTPSSAFITDTASGASGRFWTRAIPLYGFDSFEGLPERWNGFPAGTFATGARPDLPNTQLVVGRFEDTLPGFVQAHPEHVSFLHIDCDLYSSTRTVLTAFADRIVPGTVILFDEIFGFAGFEPHEYRAFCEFIAETGRQFDVIARWTTYRAAVRIA